MLTIVIPNRNRNLKTVERTLRSIVRQNPQKIKVVLIDYGSAQKYQKQLKQLVDKIGDCNLICCPTQGQLWNKSRAINIVLKQCNTPYFLVADMDMIFHPEFSERVVDFIKNDMITYFQVGILSQEESALDKVFQEYHIKFKTNEEATGITLFPTSILKSIFGYDEFYHGWGAEDTDVHVRLDNAGYSIQFYDQTCLFLHQWHPKHYRTEESSEPFHSLLERINQKYLTLTKTSKKMQANTQTAWGTIPDQERYAQFTQTLSEVAVYATQEEVEALCFQLRERFITGPVKIVIKPHPKAKKTKQKLKDVLKKRTHTFIKMKKVNEMVLSTIVSFLRNNPYRYEFNRKENKIKLFINLYKI